jgi:transcriptional regulator with XRE-family HTH domain
MTQADFAEALNVAPASIHRWEAGTSRPDFELAISLWSLAIARGSATAKHFAEFLTSRAEAIRPLFDAAQVSSMELLNSEIASLAADKHQLAFAFVRMMKHNKDQTADQVIRLLLEPWKEQRDREKPLKAAVNAPAKHSRQIPEKRRRATQKNFT